LSRKTGFEILKVSKLAEALGLGKNEKMFGDKEKSGGILNQTGLKISVGPVWFFGDWMDFI
jgi:hypothetical protein